MDRLDEHLEVTRGVLLLAEDRAADPPGGIVDATHQRESGSPAFEPVVLAAVDLQEQARLAHALATAAMARGTTPAHRRQPGLGEDPAQAPLRHHDALAIGEQVREVGPVHVPVRRRGQLGKPGPERVTQAVGRDPAAVAVGEGPCSLLSVACQEPSHRADRQSEVAGGLGRGQLACQDVVEDIEPLLCSLVQRDRLPRLHVLEGDKVAGRLGLTNSLAVHNHVVGT